jgi:hypothetical protein
MTRSTGPGHPRRHRLVRVAMVATAIGAAVVAASGIASASSGTASGTHYGVIPMTGTGTVVHPAAAADLHSNGGFIQEKPQVFLVFWGKQWSGDKNGVQSYLTRFFQGLGASGDNWSKVTSQYTGHGLHPTFSGSVLKGTWVDTSANAPGRASAGQIASEAKKGQAHFGVGTSHNVNIIVVSPHGTHPDGFNQPGAGFCAWHDATGGLPFTNMPYVLDAGTGCGQNSVGGKLDGFSIVAGHEYLEAVSDPIPPSGWVDNAGEENADKCAWMNLHKISLTTGSFAVQPTWSNKVHGCAG